MVVQIKLGIVDQSEAKREPKLCIFYYIFLVCLFSKTTIRVELLHLVILILSYE